MWGRGGVGCVVAGDCGVSDLCEDAVGGGCGEEIDCFLFDE